MSEQSRQKRQRLHRDIQLPARLQRTHPYTNIEHAILQEAASILNVAVQDLPFDRDALQPDPIINLSDTGYTQPYPLGLSGTSFLSIDRAQVDTVPETSNELFPEWAGDAQLTGLARSHLAQSTGGEQAAWNINSTETASTSSRIDRYGGNFEATAYPEGNPSGICQFSGLTITEPMPSFPGIGFDTIGNVEASFPSEDHQLLKRTNEAIFVPPVAPRRAHILHNSRSSRKVKPRRSTITHDPDFAAESAFGLWNPRGGFRPLLETNSFTSSVPLEQEGRSSELFYSEKYVPDAPFQFGRLGSDNVFPIGLAASVESLPWQFSVSDSSHSQLWSSAQGITCQSPSRQPQPEDGAGQSSDNNVFGDVADSNGSRRESNWWDKFLKWSPEEISLSDLTAAQPSDPPIEQRLVLRGPSPNGIAIPQSRWPHYQLQKNTVNLPPLKSAASPLAAPKISPIIPRPGAHETMVFSFPSAVQANATQRHRVRQSFRDPEKRKETGETRKTGACVRCHMQKIRVSIRML